MTLPMLKTKVDKVIRERNLCTNIAKLRPNRKEQVILLSKGAGVIELVDLTLEGCHIGVGDLGDGDEEEDDDEQADEARDAEVYPLHVCEGGLCVHRVGEEDTGGEEGGYERAGALDTLGDVEADFGVFWGTADGEEGVGGCFEG